MHENAENGGRGDAPGPFEARVRWVFWGLANDCVYTPQREHVPYYFTCGTLYALGSKSVISRKYLRDVPRQTAGLRMPPGGILCWHGDTLCHLLTFSTSSSSVGTGCMRRVLWPMRSAYSWSTGNADLEPEFAWSTHGCAPSSEGSMVGRLDQIQHKFGTIIKHELRAFRRQQLHRLRAKDTALRKVRRIKCRGASPCG
eukprot:scaffold103471_cov72-Phaeocystis_antarctica.AAC.2